MSAATARAVAEELSAHDVYAAHIDAQLGLDPDDLTNPSHAAISSGVSFTAGASCRSWPSGSRRAPSGSR